MTLRRITDAKMMIMMFVRYNLIGIHLIEMSCLVDCRVIYHTIFE